MIQEKLIPFLSLDCIYDPVSQRITSSDLSIIAMPMAPDLGLNLKLLGKQDFLFLLDLLGNRAKGELLLHMLTFTFPVA
jgi:hypothetical protein